MRKSLKNKKGLTRKSTTEGFIALFSVIIITSILLLIAGSLSFSGFFGRMNVYDGELKKRSDALASACIDTAILKIAQNVSYNPDNEEVDVGDSEVCTIIEVENSGVNKIIRTEGITGTGSKAYTFYETIVNPDTFEIISFRELVDRP